MILGQSLKIFTLVDTQTVSLNAIYEYFADAYKHSHARGQNAYMSPIRAETGDLCSILELKPHAGST